MNLLLFRNRDSRQSFASGSREYEHVRKVLKMNRGDRFDVGLENGPRGKACIEHLDRDKLDVVVEWGSCPERRRSVTALLGLSRPQTVQKQLNNLATLGVSRMLFFQSDRGEKSYAMSKLWTDNQWQRHVRDGIEQAFCTYLPEVILVDSLEMALAQVSDNTGAVLDNYEAEIPLKAYPWSNIPVFAIGSERGWTIRERDIFRDAGWKLVHLGERVLRCETASSLAAAHALGLI